MIQSTINFSVLQIAIKRKYHFKRVKQLHINRYQRNNDSFYSDYIRYGECTAYGKTKEMMEQSIINYPKFVILCNSKPVGCISYKEMEKKGVYEVGCLCVVKG